MQIRAAITQVLNEYPEAIKRAFTGDPLAQFIRKELPEIIAEVISDKGRYITHASPGQGNWARTPWAAVYDRLVTESAQKGYYIVYLWREDFTGVYLSLNQGVTSARQEYGGDAKWALQTRAADYLARLGPFASGLDTGKINLAASSTNNLSAFYEAGNICSVFYGSGELPPEEVLVSDLERFVELYLLLVSREPQLFERADVEEDEVSMGEEDLRRLREHKRIERNRKLSEQAKKALGYNCMACGFDFQAKYGKIGKGFIEAHHLTPLSELKGQKLSLNPKNDFAVLCSNCHRMIHRSGFVQDIEAFRTAHLVQDEG